MGDTQRASRISRRLRFGEFELDVRAGELRKHGHRIRLQEQPFQVLLMLLEHPGEVVLREDIRRRLWPNDTIVEFQPSINAAVQRLRDALVDSAEKPRYVETVARRGYRFIAQITRESADQASPGTGLREPKLTLLDALDAGQTISHYRVLGKLGTGGMGVVYRAEDLNLGREVALKFLPDELTDHPEALARFDQEGRSASALSHPNICTIYGVEDIGGQRAIAMEVVDGETLQSRLSGGPMGWREALAIGVQIASALEAAHAKGIVHRDLKPGNVMLTSGAGGFQRAKVLDFGVARRERPEAVEQETENALIKGGIILGTPCYFSPEQVQGEDADARSDIFAFGCVLYEMLAGRRAFDRADAASVIAAEPPPLSTIQRSAPAALDRLLRRCLAKDPEQRWQTARDLRAELEWITTEPLKLAWKRGFSTRFAWAAGVVLVLATLIALSVWLAPRIAPAPARNWTLSLGGIGDAVLSPDGSAALYRDARGVFMRQMNSIAEIPIYSRTPLDNRPSWSPDGSQVVFPTVAGLIRIRLPHGPPENIWPDLGLTRGLCWGPDGNILVASMRNGLGELDFVPAAGGPRKRLDVPELKDGIFYEPEFLPDSADLLFTWAADGEEHAGIYLATVRLGKVVRGPILLRRNVTAGHFAPSAGGRLLYVQDNNLYAQTLDLRAGRLAGDPQQIIEDVASVQETRRAFFSVSRDGVLAWRSGKAALARLTWFDRHGTALETAGPACEASAVLLSPDEKYLWLTIGDHFGGLVDPHQSGFMQLPGMVRPQWMPDSVNVVYTRRGSGRIWKRDLATGSELEIGRVPELSQLRAVSPDGKVLLYSADFKIYSMRIDGPLGSTNQPQLVVNRSYQAVFSPDGRWIIHVDVVDGTPEVFVQPFSFSGLPKQISSGGGTEPVWRKDGKEIVYRKGTQLYSVSVDATGHELHTAKPQVLFDVHVPAGLVGDSQPLAVTRDGSRILFAQRLDTSDSKTVYVTTAWDSDLKR